MPISRSRRAFAATVALWVAAALAPASALAAGSGGIGPGSGGTTTTTTPGSKAKLLPSGLAAAPADAPEEVKAAIAAANEIDDARLLQRRRSRSVEVALLRLLRRGQLRARLQGRRDPQGAALLLRASTSGARPARAAGSPSTTTAATPSSRSPGCASTPRFPTTASPAPAGARTSRPASSTARSRSATTPGSSTTAAAAVISFAARCVGSSNPIFLGVIPCPGLWSWR